MNSNKSNLRNERRQEDLRPNHIRNVYAQAIRYYVTYVAIVALVVCPPVKSLIEGNTIVASCEITSSAEDKGNIELEETTAIVTTTTCPVTQTSTTTTTTTEATTTCEETTTEVVTTSVEIIEEEALYTPEVVYEEEIQEEEYYEEVYYEEPVLEEEIVQDTYVEETYEESYEESYDSSLTYQGSFEATWYDSRIGTIGARGTRLTSGYSVASNYFPLGTELYIEGFGLDGYYLVEDTGGMSNNVIDFFYDYGCTPSDFAYAGRVNIEVYTVN